MTDIRKKQIADHLYKTGMRCNCDLDNWQPEQSTGHSHVCRIHKAAIGASKQLISDIRGVESHE